MGVLLKADFRIKIPPKALRFNPRNPSADYHAGIFAELYSAFPQFKAHVAMYVERNYCAAVNDEDHADPKSLLSFLKPEEVRRLNEWIVNKGRRHRRAT
ncbi:MAG: hypothetical protein HY579_12555 [Nitrospinae bacterium]|nr:hypothetical protein [Nitrospinota bacterium]